MAEIARERVGRNQQIVLRILDDSPDGIKASDVIEEVRRKLQPTDFEKSFYPDTQQERYGKILRFSTIAPVKAGWILKSKGTRFITDDGGVAYKTFSDPTALEKESGLQGDGAPPGTVASPKRTASDAE